MFRALVRYQSLGQFGRTWDLLHPAHQQVVGRSQFDGCQRESTSVPDGEIELTVIEIYDDPIDIPAIPERTSTAVTYRLRLVGTDAGQTKTSHAVNVDGEWRWVLAPQDVGVYRRGECPL